MHEVKKQTIKVKGRFSPLTSMLASVVQKILQKNQELELTISKGEERMEVMTIETDNL